MKITRLTLLMIIILMLLSPSCSKKEKNRYTDKSKNFSIVISPDLEKKTNYMGTDIIVFPHYEKSVSSFRPNFNVSVLKYESKQSLNPYAEETLQSLKTLPDFNLIEKKKDEMGDKEAIKFIYTYSMGPLKIKVLQYIIVKDTRGAAVTFSSLEEDYDTLVSETDNKMKTFRLE